MNEILIMAFVSRIKAEPPQMAIEQVPIPLQEEVEKKVKQNVDNVFDNLII